MKVTQALAAAMIASMNSVHVAEFMEGLFSGLIQDDGLNNLQSCVKDASTLEKVEKALVADYEAHDLLGLCNGVKLIWKTGHQLEGDIADCKAVKSDVQRIEEWTHIFDSPKELVQIIVSNGLANIGTIRSDVSTAMADYHSADFKGTGFQVADILTKTMGKVPSAVNPESII